MGKTISPQWPQLRQCRYHLDLMHAAATHSLQSAVRHINTLIDELAPTPTPCSASTLFDLNPNAPTLRADTSACGDDNASADAEARLFEELRLLISSDCWPAASIAERCSADAATTLAARLNTLVIILLQCCASTLRRIHAHTSLRTYACACGCAFACAFAHVRARKQAHAPYTLPITPHSSPHVITAPAPPPRASARRWDGAINCIEEESHSDHTALRIALRCTALHHIETGVVPIARAHRCTGCAVC